MNQRIIPVIVLILALAGCTRAEKVRAIEAPAGLPYESLGTVRVKTRALKVTPGAVLDGAVEAVTLTKADTPTRTERYKRILQKKLARTARDRYDAHAVINVRYWPDPSQGYFPDGIIHAQGEMIRYQKFPNAGEPPAPSTPQ